MHVLTDVQVMPDVNRVLTQMKKFTEVLIHYHVYICLAWDEYKICCMYPQLDQDTFLQDWQPNYNCYSKIWDLAIGELIM